MSNPLIDVFVHLMLYHRSAIEWASMPGTILDMSLALQNEELNVVPRISSAAVRSIAEGALRGDVKAMYTLGMLYNVGLGLPRSEKHAAEWASMSLLEVNQLGFKRARKDLKTHLSELDDTDFSYPPVIRRIYDDLVPRHRKLDPDRVPKGTWLVSPLFAGVRMMLVYRVDEQSGLCYLYDARAFGMRGDRVSLDIASKLNVPAVLGSIRNRPTIPNYADRVAKFAAPANYFVVGDVP